ncbi:MAG: MarR family transcriptional regulator [Euryarchaeota archaeon]|nr:MarR family transcriptional regulator [Euryarchaeota archaeon]
MVVILGTLGFRPETLIPTIRSTERLSSVIVFHSDHERSKDAAKDIRRLCELMGVQLIEREIPDAFDFMTVAKAIQDDILEARKKEETIGVFNIAGGTRIMSASALLVCTLEGLNTVYVHDNTLEEIPLPMLHIRYSDILTDVQKSLLKYLVQNKGRDITQGDLAKEFGMHKATINHHIKKLQEKGTVHLETKKGDGREKIVRAEVSMELLLR